MNGDDLFFFQGNFRSAAAERHKIRTIPGLSLPGAGEALGPWLMAPTTWATLSEGTAKEQSTKEMTLLSGNRISLPSQQKDGPFGDDQRRCPTTGNNGHAGPVLATADLWSDTRVAL